MGLSESRVESQEARRVISRVGDGLRGPDAVYLDDGSGVGTLVVIGTSVRERLLYVVHVQRGERDRIINARPAERGERAVYEAGEQL